MPTKMTGEEIELNLAELGFDKDNWESNLESLLSNHNITKKDFAKKISITEKKFYPISNAKTEPSEDQLIKIIHGLMVLDAIKKDKEEKEKAKDDSKAENKLVTDKKLNEEEEKRELEHQKLMEEREKEALKLKDRKNNAPLKIDFVIQRPLKQIAIDIIPEIRKKITDDGENPNAQPIHLTLSATQPTHFTNGMDEFSDIADRNFPTGIEIRYKLK